MVIILKAKQEKNVIQLTALELKCYQSLLL